MSQSEIAEIVGCSQPYISKIITSYQLSGDSIFTESRKNNGTLSALSATDLAKLADLLQQSPTEYGYEGELWTKYRIVDMIERYFNISYHPNSIYVLMKKIKFSAQKPILKDYRQDSSKVEEFVSQKMPELKKKAEEEQRKIVFQDEAIVRLLPTLSRSYAPIGKAPTLSCDAKNKRWLSISAAISAEGYLYYEIRENEGFKGSAITRFLDNIVADCLDKLLVVWDNSSVHTSKHVKTFCQQNATNPRVWLANTPPYSPELNPTEQLWSCVKQRLANKFHKTTKELKENLIEVLDEIKRNKAIIKNLFKKEIIRNYNLT